SGNAPSTDSLGSARARTRSPAAASRATSRRPMKPVAPVTRRVIEAPCRGGVARACPDPTAAAPPAKPPSVLGQVRLLNDSRDAALGPAPLRPPLLQIATRLKPVEAWLHIGEGATAFVGEAGPLTELRRGLVEIEPAIVHAEEIGVRLQHRAPRT